MYKDVLGRKNKRFLLNQKSQRSISLKQHLPTLTRERLIFISVIAIAVFLVQNVPHIGFAEGFAKKQPRTLLDIEDLQSTSRVHRPQFYPHLRHELSVATRSGSAQSVHLARGVSAIPNLENADLTFNRNGELFLSSLPRFSSYLGDQAVGISSKNEFVFYSISERLQEFVSRTVATTNAPHVAAVVMEPHTGRILAAAQKSSQIKNMLMHTDFPAASMFKIVATAVALEQNALAPNDPINFRGGTYTLERWNYLADPKRDIRSMTLTEALGKSCNPAFARIALQHLNPDLVHRQARMFGFNSDLFFDSPISESRIVIPHNNDYEFSRTVAGFGAVTISPIHAAAMMSGIANKGLLPRPSLVDKVISFDGQPIYSNRPEMLRRMVSSRTADTLLEMMESTTTVGTSRRAFSGTNRLNNISVSGKTGTLRGPNPRGINNWFIGAGPIENPELSIAVVVVDPNHISTRASEIARHIFDFHFRESKTVAMPYASLH